MPVAVLIPTVLLPKTRGRQRLECSAPITLGELFVELAKDYTDLVDIVVRDGVLSRFTNVYLNGEDVRAGGGLRTTLSDGDEITIITAMAGG